MGVAWEMRSGVSRTESESESLEEVIGLIYVERSWVRSMLLGEMTEWGCSGRCGRV